MKTAFGTLALLLLMPVAGLAQSAVSVGSRVRITAPNHDLTKHVATVVAVRGDTLALAGNGGVRAVPLASVTKLEVSAGTRNRLLRDAGIGFGAGFVVGAILGAATYEGPSLFTDSATEEALWAGSTLGAVGLIVGGVVGLFHRTDRWENRSLPVRASVQPSKSGGFSLTVSRAF